LRRRGSSADGRIGSDCKRRGCRPEIPHPTATKYLNHKKTNANPTLCLNRSGLDWWAWSTYHKVTKIKINRNHKHRQLNQRNTTNNGPSRYRISLAGRWVGGGMAPEQRIAYQAQSGGGGLSALVWVLEHRDRDHARACVRGCRGCGGGVRWGGRMETTKTQNSSQPRQTQLRFLIIHGPSSTAPPKGLNPPLSAALRALKPSSPRVHRVVQK